MKQLLLIIAAVGCASISPEQSTIVEKAIRLKLNKPTGEITKADLEKVKVLSLHNKKFTEVPKGLEKLTQLERLYLSNNQLTDVKGLEKLTKLTHLFLGDNQLTDVKGLEKLTQLTYLDLRNNQLTDVRRPWENSRSYGV